ncbi:MAG TPA: hypothetical protein VFH45_00185 [Acidimicrobiales bacterium]|nr:hypothetical protein [Acidimicrobiales bacterium]
MRAVVRRPRAPTRRRVGPTWAARAAIGLALLGLALVAVPAVGSAPAAASASGGPGYWLVSSTGDVAPVGPLPRYRAPTAGARIVAAASLPDGSGFWVVRSDGGVLAFGAASFHGSMRGRSMGGRPTGMAAAPDGNGYWLVDSVGDVYAFGSARFLGSAGGAVRSTVVGIAADPAGGGYWLLTSRGSVLSFGAPWFGSAAADATAAHPAVAIAAMGAGAGYRIAMSDGRVATLTRTGHDLSPPGPMRQTVTSITEAAGDAGFWLVGAGGGVLAYGSAAFLGSDTGRQPGTAVGLVPASGSPAGSPLPHGATGYDISWPQCGGTLPALPGGPAVVGVNNGSTFTVNPCLAAEASWAGSHLSLYINLSSPDPGSRWAAHGPRGRCGTRAGACRSYNYGWNAASWSVDRATAAGATSGMWWLDVETGNVWGADRAANRQVIQGAIDALHNRGLTVGAYSTTLQWGEVAGDYRPGIPGWLTVLGSPPAPWCSTVRFTGGPTWLVQTVGTVLDTDYAC